MLLCYYVIIRTYFLLIRKKVIKEHNEKGEGECDALGSAIRKSGSGGRVVERERADDGDRESRINIRSR